MDDRKTPIANGHRQAISSIVFLALPLLQYLRFLVGPLLMGAGYQGAEWPANFLLPFGVLFTILQLGAGLFLVVGLGLAGNVIFRKGFRQRWYLITGLTLSALLFLFVPMIGIYFNATKLMALLALVCFAIGFASRANAAVHPSS
jgi:hypothetical protein